MTQFANEIADLRNTLFSAPASSADLHWGPVVGRVMKQLGFHAAFLGVVRDDIAYVRAAFPQSQHLKIQSFPLAGTLTLWTLQNSKSVTALHDLQSDLLRGYAPYFAGDSTKAFAGACFAVGEASGFLVMQSFRERGRFSAAERRLISELALHLRLGYQADLIEAWDVAGGPIAEDPGLPLALYAGINRGELLLHYQPYWDACMHRPLGFEGLVRWRQSDGRLIPPVEFIPVAERTGLIYQLGEHVREMAFASAHTLGASAWIGVNLSPLAIDESLPERLHARLTKANLRPDRVVLEVTETVAAQGCPDVIEALVRCADVGVRIAIDDFGAGYASIESLKAFPVDIIKIDRSIVRNLPHRAVDAHTAETAIEAARRLNGTVIAEGVETMEQLEWLLDRGCTIIQGYLISPPQSLDDILRTVQSDRTRSYSSRLG